MPRGSTPPGSARLTFSAADVRLELRADPGRLGEQAAEARKRSLADFARCDTNSNGALDHPELSDPRAQPFRQITDVADRDGDGRLDDKEFAAWLDLQDQVAKGHVLLTILDLGTSLRIPRRGTMTVHSPVRELRTAWARLNSAGCVVAGLLDRTRLPRYLLATVSHGLPHTTLGTAPRHGPDWFRAMDRNRDGDVSRSASSSDRPPIFDRLDRGQGRLGNGRRGGIVPPRLIPILYRPEEVWTGLRVMPWGAASRMNVVRVSLH